MKNQQAAMSCDAARESIRWYVEGALEASQAAALTLHIQECQDCKNEFEARSEVIDLLSKTFEPIQISKGFDLSTNNRLRSLRQTPTGPLALPVGMASASKCTHPASIAVSCADESNEMEERTATQSDNQESLSSRFGTAPWWAVSVLLHALVITLAGLISMAIDNPQTEDAVVMITEWQQQSEINVSEDQKVKPSAVDVLESKDVPPTDPTSPEASDIVIPPDILAQAELGNHFETINPDRPDTQSAFGNPEVHMFHSVRGYDEPEGGGGMGGTGLDDLIGVGGIVSQGSGGGWGGGNGTGTGIGNGSGHGSFGLRGGSGRKLMVKRHGGSPATESAVDRALQWLAYHQEPDGHWDCDKYQGEKPYDAAMTGLALLAFLGAGHTEKTGVWKENVIRAVTWLKSQQKEDGAIHLGRSGYCESITALALAEAAGMGNMPETRKAAQRAIDYCTEIHQR